MYQINRKKNFKIAVAALCAINLFMLWFIAPIVKADDQDKTPPLNSRKSEVVYAGLKSDGSVKEVYIVNHFSDDTGQQADNINGQAEIKDYGAYSDVESLALTGNISQQADVITVHKTGQNYYYKGTLKTKELPWRIKLEHQLDGKSVSAEDLAGKSGEWQLNIHIEPNAQLKENLWAENLMLQITANLSDSTVQNLKADKGMTAETGSHKTVTFMMLPNETKTDFQIEATVKDFMMPSIQIAAVPFSLDMLQFDIPDLSDNEKLNELKEATQLLAQGSLKFADGIAELNSGSKPLTEGLQQITNSGKTIEAGGDRLAQGLTDYTSGLGTLAGQTQNLISGAESIQSSAYTIATNLEQLTTVNQDIQNLVSGSNAIKNGLNQMASGLDSIDMESLKTAMAGLNQLESQIAAFKTQLTTTLDSLNALNTGLIQLKTGLAAYQDTLTRESILSGVDLTEENIQTNPEAQKILGYIDLMNNNTEIPFSLINIINGITTMQVNLEEQLNSPAISDVNTALDQLSQLSKLATLADLIDGLEGIIELNNQYDAFNQGFIQYVNGVTQLSHGYYQAGSQENFYSGLSAYLAGTNQFANGVNSIHAASPELNNGMHQFTTGNKQYINGVSEWANGYQQFSAGISGLLEPANQLADGNQKLADGAANMDREINQMINQILAEYEIDSEIPSFASAKNAIPQQVQFVLLTDPVTKTENENENNLTEITETNESIWQRFLDLFR